MTHSLAKQSRCIVFSPQIYPFTFSGKDQMVKIGGDFL